MTRFVAAYLIVGLFVLGWAGSVASRAGKLDNWTGRDVLLIVGLWPMAAGILTERTLP